MCQVSNLACLPWGFSPAGEALCHRVVLVVTLQGQGQMEALLQAFVLLQALELQHCNMEFLSHLYLLNLMAVLLAFGPAGSLMSKDPFFKFWYHGPSNPPSSSHPCDLRPEVPRICSILERPDIASLRLAKFGFQAVLKMRLYPIYLIYIYINV